MPSKVEPAVSVESGMCCTWKAAPVAKKVPLWNKVHLTCYDWIVSPQDSYVEVFISSMMVHGDGALGRKLSLDEVMSVMSLKWD